MAKYDKETKFYWLQLKEDFFEDDAIEWLEEQEPNGRDYAYFYLKLCLKSLKSNGVLIREVGNILIPYDNKKLAELTKMDFDTVTVAMELLKKIGLIKVLENGEIYISQLENLIGSQSKGALKKQQQRLLRGQKGDKCPPKIELKIEQEIELDKENNKRKYGEFENVLLTDEEYAKLEKSNLLPYIETLSSYIASKGKKYKSHYATILNWSKRKNKEDNKYNGLTFKEQKMLREQEILDKLARGEI